jgi:hypothetical protein
VEKSQDVGILGRDILGGKYGGEKVRRGETFSGTREVPFKRHFWRYWMSLGFLEVMR